MHRFGQPLSILNKFRICPAAPLATVPSDFDQGLRLLLPRSDLAQQFADSNLSCLHAGLGLYMRNAECQLIHRWNHPHDPCRWQSGPHLQYLWRPHPRCHKIPVTALLASKAHAGHSLKVYLCACSFGESV